MPISNGFDEALVLPALSARKGWTQPTDASFSPVLSDAVKECLSGLPFNRDHQVCGPALLWQAQPDKTISSDNLNQYLLDLKKANIMDCLNGVFIIDQLIEHPKNIFSKNFRTAYKPIPNTGKFCGWQLNVAEGDFAVKINSIGLIMSGACTVKIYLYNDLIAQPLWTLDVVVPEGRSQTIVNIDDLILHYQDATHKTGTFFYGYYQDQLAAQGVEALDVYLDQFNFYNMVGYQCFEADSNYAAKTFVRQQYQTNYRTYGLNLEMSSYHDFTNTIVRNASQFDRLIGMNMIAKCIEEVIYSPRINGGKVLAQEQLDSLSKLLQGSIQNPNTKEAFAVNIPYRTGLKNKIEREMYRMTQTFIPDDKVFVSISPVNKDYSDGGQTWNRNDLGMNWGHQI